jgi:hypothetical protein
VILSTKIQRCARCGGPLDKPRGSRRKICTGCRLEDALLVSAGRDGLYEYREAVKKAAAAIEHDLTVGKETRVETQT